MATLELETMPALGVGVANDLCEPGVLQLIHGLVQADLIGYLTVYVYDNYPQWFVDSMRQALPEQLSYVWHGSGDFELPLAEDSIESSWGRIDEVQRTWQPAWATEDLIVTTFGRTKPQGHPNYVPLFLTEESLDVCVRRTRDATERLPMPLLPEVPHFFAPVPQTMELTTFLRRYCEEADTYLNLDVGHLFSYNLMAGKDPVDGVDDLPLDRVVEINCSGGMVGDSQLRTWVDDYTAPLNPFTVEVLSYVIPRCPNLRAIYTETIWADPKTLLSNVEVLNSLFWSAVKAS